MGFRLLVLSMWILAEALGYLGFLMIIYSVIAENTAPWPPIEAKASFISALATLVGTIVTAASVYFIRPVIRPAWQHSKFIISPIVILMCAFALYALFVRQEIATCDGK